VGLKRVGDYWDPPPLLSEATVTDIGADLVVVAFDAERHTDMVRDWAAHRSNINVPFDRLPPTGFVIEDLAVVFMYRTDGPVVLIEALITNPESTAELRGAGIERVVGALFDQARAEGYRVAMAVTPRGAIVERAKRLGFTAASEPETFISREINAPYHRRD
jgi:hypothetical protein